MKIKKLGISEVGAIDLRAGEVSIESLYTQAANGVESAKLWVSNSEGKISIGSSHGVLDVKGGDTLVNIGRLNNKKITLDTKGDVHFHLMNVGENSEIKSLGKIYATVDKNFKGSLYLKREKEYF